MLKFKLILWSFTYILMKMFAILNIEGEGGCLHVCF